MRGRWRGWGGGVAEHPLIRMARGMTADPAEHDRVAVIAARLQATLDAALADPDLTRARVILPEALRQVGLASTALVGGGLVPGPEWFYQAHRQLYAKAVMLFGPQQGVIAPCPVEPMPRASGWPGRLFPR
jgi:hypothetical protein